MKHRGLFVAAALAAVSGLLMAAPLNVGPASKSTVTATFRQEGVAVEKSFRDRKPVTQLMLTTTGRAALERHVEQLLQALRPPVSDVADKVQSSGEAVHGDDWID